MGVILRASHHDRRSPRCGARHDRVQRPLGHFRHKHHISPRMHDHAIYDSQFWAPQDWSELGHREQPLQLIRRVWQACIASNCMEQWKRVTLRGKDKILVGQPAKSLGVRRQIQVRKRLRHKKRVHAVIQSLGPDVSNGSKPTFDTTEGVDGIRKRIGDVNIEEIASGLMQIESGLKQLGSQGTIPSWRHSHTHDVVHIQHLRQRRILGPERSPIGMSPHRPLNVTDHSLH
mmetsp:Transcript_28367/g.62571  ORF Transcript_28367/g.62571 Transcript_28367/m.62571 type:complete len:231 (-) Transcript_28367:108-800(-)